MEVFTMAVISNTQVTALIFVKWKTSFEEYAGKQLQGCLSMGWDRFGYTATISSHFNLLQQRWNGQLGIVEGGKKQECSSDTVSNIVWRSRHLARKPSESLMVLQLGKDSLRTEALMGFFEKQKLTGPNFIDWYRPLRIVISIDDKLNTSSSHFPPAPCSSCVGQQVALKSLAAHTVGFNGSKEIAGLMKKAVYASDFDGFVQNYNMHALGKTNGNNAQTNRKPSKAGGDNNQGIWENLSTLLLPSPSNSPSTRGRSRNGLKSVMRVVETGIGKRECHQFLSRVAKKKYEHSLWSGGGSVSRLDSALLWHCRLGHISKKRIEKLQHDGLLNSTDLRAFEKCVPCMSVQEFLDSSQGSWIIAHHTLPYTPQHMSFWDYALETAARILNMVPTKKVEKTPYEVWHGQAPKLSYLKVWGCEALLSEYSYKPDKEDTHPSIDTSLNHEEDDLEMDEPQSDIIPIRRSRRPTDRLCLYIDAEEHELGISSEPASYKSCIVRPWTLIKWLNAHECGNESIKDNEFEILNPGDLHWTTVKKHSEVSQGILKECFSLWSSQTGIMENSFLGAGVVPTIEKPINMYCDNTGAIAIANESGITKGARHFRAKVHYLREVIEFGDIKLEKVHTDDNLADPFTKALAFPKHSELTRNIGMLPASSFM
ncbi:retrotransposon protein, putative, ty1-copia subclass [Tanacetum coccineum]|uniref:Retrotransposon protein, putative, ty1-copia subclass n=1 Tax=Tanacetum coccineum TaxID=301880 RepID=A0ABQ5CSS0_9ASTR